MISATPARFLVRLTVVFGLSLPGPIGTAAERPPVLAHTMPWYASKPVSGAWGWHWTMDRFDPDTIRPDGRREAASHDEPLIGLYDSGDPAVLECQALQMKLAGLDGVVVDWYGIRDHLDYAMAHRNTERLISAVKRAGLRFAICYEDQAVGRMIRDGVLAEADAVAHGRETLRWMDEHWFSDPAYLAWEERPALLVFGPQYFDREQWTALRRGLKRPPRLFGLPHLFAGAGFDGAYGWPPVSGGETVPPERWRRELDALHAGGRAIGVAFPGFHDIYREAGVHDSYGFIDARDGRTFAETLELALGSGAPFVQIATWNDHGEGTTIEPTRGHGYRYLEILRRRLAPRDPDGNAVTDEHLRLPARLFDLRKKSGIAPDPRLDAIADLLFEGRCAEAAKGLADFPEP